jgi:organic radical activating enzyme
VFTKTPDLLDLKITDQCNKCCNFCSQNSSSDGFHADFIEIKRLINAIKFNGISVFECALGGGEPTLHPEFPKILKELNGAFGSISFTTNDMFWYDNSKIVKSIKRYVKAYAHSLTTKYEIQHIVTAHLEANLPNTELHFNYIPDLFPLENLLNIVDSLAFQIRHTNKQFCLTLLGIKSIGKGAFVTNLNHTNIIEQLLALQTSLKGFPSIGIDTKFAADHQSELISNNIRPSLFFLEEGKYSMYIDLVEQVYAESSYCAERFSYSDCMEPFEWFDGIKKG